jgi:hypothetical protein
MSSYIRFQFAMALPMGLMFGGIMAVSHAQSGEGYGRFEEIGGVILFVAGLILLPVLLVKLFRS